MFVPFFSHIQEFFYTFFETISSGSLDEVCYFHDIPWRKTYNLINLNSSKGSVNFLPSDLVIKIISLKKKALWYIEFKSSSPSKRCFRTFGHVALSYAVRNSERKNEYGRIRMMKTWITHSTFWWFSEEKDIFYHLR